MYRLPAAEAWQVSQVVVTKACVACVMFMGPKVPAAYVVVLWQEPQSVPDRYGMCLAICGYRVVIIVVEGQLRGAVALDAIAGDAGVQY